MDLMSLLPVRSPLDSLRGIARLEFGGQEYVLPTLPIEDNETWLAGIDGQIVGLLAGVDAAGDDLPRILGLLTSQGSALLLLLKSYDKQNLLPPIAEIRKRARPHELLFAVLAIWRAANPLVDIALMGLALGTSGPSTGLTSLLRTNGAGTSKRSGPTSARSSSSASSMPQPTGSSATGKRTSKPHGRARSSRPTRSNTTAGELGPNPEAVAK